MPTSLGEDSWKIIARLVGRSTAGVIAWVRIIIFLHFHWSKTKTKKFCKCFPFILLHKIHRVTV